MELGTRLNRGINRAVTIEDSAISFDRHVGYSVDAQQNGGPASA